MAIDAVGIGTASNDGKILKSLSIGSSDGTVPLFFKFKTGTNTWLKANIWVTVDIVRKGGNESLNSYALAGADGCTDVNRWTSPAPVAVDGGYVYSMALTNALMDDVETLIGTLSYSGRSYDAIRLTVEVKVVWGAGANDYVKGAQTCYIGFKPTYSATSAVYTTKGLEVTYSASGWTRPNDRYTTSAITSGGKATVDKGVKGTAQAAGKLTIPKASIKRIPVTGESLSGSLTMRGSWQGEDSSLGTMSLSGVTVTNSTTVKKPTITATAQNGGVLVKWTANGAGSTTPTAVDVQMVGSDYVSDRATITALNGTHFFDAVPAGSSTSWQAAAYVLGDDSYNPTLSDIVTATAVSIEGVEIVPADGSGAVRLPYNAAVTRNARPESETVKLAGRSRETVGFGEGGAVTWTVSGSIVTGERAHVTSTQGLTVTTPEEWAALPERGVCVIRTQDGRRAQVYVTNANVSRSIGGNGLRSVSISAEEVS